MLIMIEMFSPLEAAISMKSGTAVRLCHSSAPYGFGTQES